MADKDNGHDEQKSRSKKKDKGAVAEVTEVSVEDEQKKRPKKKDKATVAGVTEVSVENEQTEEVVEVEDPVSPRLRRISSFY